jgi:hypothetical protein
MSWDAALDEQVGQHVEDVDRVELAADPDRQARAGEFIEDNKHAVFPSVMGTVLDEVVGPDMVGVGIFRPQPDAGPVRQPEPAPFGLLRRHFQPLPPPDPLGPLVVDPPARWAQQRRHHAVREGDGGADDPAPGGGATWDDLVYRRLFVLDMDAFIKLQIDSTMTYPFGILTGPRRAPWWA